VISAIVFSCTNIRPPEDAARQAMGHTVTQEQIDTFIHANGLDKPAVERYVAWLGDYITGNWGTSAITERPVQPEVTGRLGRSLILALLSLAIAVPVAMALAVMMAKVRGSKLDIAITMPLIILSALPEFVVGLALAFCLALYLPLLPLDSTAVSFGTTGEVVLAYVLPALSLSAGVVPYIARVGRASLATVMESSYVRAAVLRGLSPWLILRDYSIRNSLIQIINAFSINFVYLMGGVIVIENLFGFPGLGQLLVQSIGRTDYLMVQASAMALGVVVVLVTMVTDALSLCLDPRLKGRAA
jgi:peptide/nickel transport system permease protein